MSKSLILVGLAAALAGCLISGAASASVRVRGYSTRSGTYVAPHARTEPDHSRLNNWSTRGNINPYTGAAGTKPVIAPARRSGR